MLERLRELIATTPFHHEGLRQIGALLPESDEELNQSLAALAKERDSLHFVYMTMGAAMVGRKLQAYLLRDGLALSASDNLFAWIAWHMEGDVAEHTLAALQQGPPVSLELEVMAIFVAAAWWQKHREGPFPPAVMSLGRRLGRKNELRNEVRGTLAALACLTDDPVLRKMAQVDLSPDVTVAAGRVKDGLLGFMDGPFEALVPPEKSDEANGTIRRSVERIGRNERCPCGSGAKYKHCCAGRDRERLRLSGEVAGKTRAESHADLTAGLNWSRLEKMPSSSIARLDPARVPELLRIEYILRLAIFCLWEELARAFEVYGLEGEMEAHWKRSFFFQIRRWDRAGAARLLAVHPRGAAMLPEIPEPGLRMLMASDDPAAFLQTVEAEAEAALKSSDEEQWGRVALGLLASPYPGLGIYVARSLLPLVEKPTWIFDQILETRDRLGLPPTDEMSEFMDKRAAREPKGGAPETLRQAQARLEKKATEVREVQERLVALQREIALRERRESRPADVSRPVAPETERRQEMSDMRAKVDRLQGLLQERGEERLTLRREVEKLHEKVETLRAGQTSGRADEALGETEEAGEPVQVSGQQPVRLIEFPKKFGDALARFPIAVGRGVMQHLGQIASGEATAFMGLTKMHDCHNVLRLRVAGDYRLLLALWPDRVQVIDVVNRRDLQARLKTLRAQGM